MTTPTYTHTWTRETNKEMAESGEPDTTVDKREEEEEDANSTTEEISFRSLVNPAICGVDEFAIFHHRRG